MPEYVPCHHPVEGHLIPAAAFFPSADDLRWLLSLSVYLNNIHNIVLDIDNNEASNLKINAFGNRSFLFDAKKMVEKGYEFYARGATFISPSCSKTHNPIVGGGIYNVGDICTTSLSDIDVILPNNYYYNLFDDLWKYDNNMKNYLK